jgi:hypothetical protein
MFESHDRAFKEWALVCEAMTEGRQIALIRKGGIREEEGVFQVNDPEFFLMPTYEHQKPDLLQEPYVADLETMRKIPFDPRNITIDAYALVDAVRTCDDEDRLRQLAHERLWNEKYLQMRLNFNPYDPLYVLILRVYRLPNATTLPLLPAYAGCKSWVTLELPLSTDGAVPAIPDDEFMVRREKLLDLLDGRM